MSKNDTIDIQIITTYIFIITVIVNLFLLYNEKYNYINNTNKQIINKINRLIIVFSIGIFLYLNYKNYINTKTNTSKLQLSASFLTFCASIIILFVAFTSNTNIQNPQI